MNKPSPDKVYGPQLASLFQQYCELVHKESGASGMRVDAVFKFSKGKKGDLQFKTFVTVDSKTERMLDPDSPMPRGSKLQHDAVAAMRSVLVAAETAVQEDMGRRLALFEQQAKELLGLSSQLTVAEKRRRWSQLLPFLNPPNA